MTEVLNCNYYIVSEDETSIKLRKNLDWQTHSARYKELTIIKPNSFSFLGNEFKAMRYLAFQQGSDHDVEMFANVFNHIKSLNNKYNHIHKLLENMENKYGREDY